MFFKEWKGLRHVGLWRLFCTGTLIWAVGCEDGQGDKTVSEGDTSISAPDVRSVADAAAADTGEAPDARLPGVDVDESDAKEVGEDIGEDAAGPLEPTACNDGVDSDGDGLVDWMDDPGCYGPDDDSEEALEREQENGWTTFDPSSDTRIVYVSASQGDDENDGLSPEAPVKTIEAGMALLRSGYPDWLLLRRGDVWEEAIGWSDRSGRSAEERMVIASYGESTARPMLKTDGETALSLCCGAASHVAFLDLDFYAYTRDPDSPEYRADAEGKTSISICCGAGENLLFEGIRTRFYSSMVLQTGEGHPRNVEFRRNVVYANYPSPGGGHSQGVYASHIQGFLVEENIFDQNGWHPDIEGAEATMFNHNMYLSGGSDLVVRGNIFSRASSMGIKMRSDVTGDYQRLLFEDNFFYDGEIGMGVGGNTDEPYRFEDTRIRNNVFLEMGKTMPTGRDFAWMLELSDHRDLVVSDNYFLHQPWHTNGYGIYLHSGTQENVQIENNFVYDVQGRGIWIDSASGWSDVSVVGNTIQAGNLEVPMIRHRGPFEPVYYADNFYFTGASDDAWFRVDGDRISYAEWLERSGEQGSSVQEISYPDPERRLGDYNASLGREGTSEAFLEEARQQSKFNWRAEYTGSAVNAYLRAGFGD